MNEYIQIDRTSPLPLYKQLEDSIVRAIGDGELKAGDKLPTEEELADQFGLSRPVVRQAYGALVGAKLVVRERGRGSFVKELKPGPLTNSLLGFSQETLLSGHIPVTKVLAFEKSRLPERLGQMVENPWDEWFYLERVRFTDGVPSSHLKTWVPVERFPGIGTYNFEIDSLYATLYKLYGVRPNLSRRTVWATAADERTANALQVEPGSPVSKLVNVVYDERDQLMEVGVEHYPADTYSFTFEVHDA